MTTTIQVPIATINIEWNHPTHGRVAEMVCSRHEGEILAALHCLGIGCGGRPYAGPLGCGRCLAEVGGVQPRQYVRMTGAAPAGQE